MLKRKGQSSLEYMILVIIVLGAFLAVGNYFKRGIQGRWKVSVDDVGDQYDPRATNQDITHRIITNTESIITSTPVQGGFWTLRTDQTNSLEIKQGFMRVFAF